MTAPTRQEIPDNHHSAGLSAAIQHVILDRDGVLNEEPADGRYVSDPDDFRWMPGALDALAALRALGVRITVATNQSGVGRGLMTESALAAVHHKMTSDAARAGGSIDAIFCCPHSPDAACSCRKPAPGLIEAAIRQSGIARTNTLVIGDAARDLEAAHAAGAPAALLRTGKGREHEAVAGAQGIPVFEDLNTLVAELTLKNSRRELNIEPLQAIFSEHAAVIGQSAATLLPLLAECIALTRRCLAAGGKILACGNGGSAADAQHFVAELVGRYHSSRQALGAIALASDPATLTAVSNDFGFEHVFARQVEAFAKPGDVLIAISTSGNSRNVLNAVDSARERGCTVIALTGRSGGELIRHADITLPVPSETVARIQEVHGLCLHALAEALEDATVKPSAP